MALDLQLRLGPRLWPYYLKVQPFVRAVLLLLAGVWRRLMFRTTFIAVSGSVGKTTAKDAIGLVLGKNFRTYKTVGSANHYTGLTKNLLSVRPWHRYAVIEIGLDRPGQMKWFAYTVKPDIAVWVNVARTHTRSFKTLETIAKEKSLLVESLRPGGVALLNCDNPFISAYKPPANIRAIRYGKSEGMEWRASKLSSKWPSSFSFEVESSKEQGKVSTMLIGTHWLPSVLPAVIAGHLAGLTLAQSAAALAQLSSMQLRMSPAATPRGATFLRDEWNGSVDTLTVALDVMRDAEAKRKIIVFSDVSDSTQRDPRRQRGMGQAVSEIADLAVFVGDNSRYGLKGALDAGMASDRVWAFYDIQGAAEFLQTELRDGDLVLLRGRTLDHMSRLYLAMLGEVNCWLPTCKKMIQCDHCPELKSNARGTEPLVQISS
jgi:UDP-N-acetylmuramoyl-tripeptide--D-alanyl-D-alanine ligase